jgi:hypothetical protein
MSDSSAESVVQLGRVREDMHTAVSELNGRLDDVVISQEEQLTSSVSRLDIKLTEQGKLLTTRVDSDHAHFSGLHECLSASISSTQRDGAAALRLVEESLNKKHGDKLVATDARIAAMGRHFTEVCTAIERTFNTNLDELDKAFVTGCTNLDTKIAGIVSDLAEASNTASRRLETLTTDLTSEAELRCASDESTATSLQESIANAEAEFANQLAALRSANLKGFSNASERQDQLSQVVDTVSTELGVLSAAGVENSNRFDKLNMRVLDAAHTLDALKEEVAQALEELQEELAGVKNDGDIDNLLFSAAHAALHQ